MGSKAQVEGWAFAGNGTPFSIVSKVKKESQLINKFGCRKLSLFRF